MDQDIAAETGFREYSSGHVTCRNDSVQMILENSSLQECSPGAILAKVMNQPVFGNRITPTIA